MMKKPGKPGPPSGQGDGQNAQPARPPAGQAGPRVGPGAAAHGPRHPGPRAPSPGLKRPGVPEPIAPRYRPAAPDPGPQAAPREQIDFLAGQVQSLATRLEALRGQGAGQTPEFKQLEQMLGVVQDRLLLAQRKLDARS